MIRTIVTDTNLLSSKSVPVPEETAAQIIIQDLLDTANSIGNCAGLAAIQIGYPLRVCVVKVGESFRPLVNPEIIARFGGMKSSREGCLSLPGKTIVKRRFKEVKLSTGERFKGIAATAIQHEVDHLDGILL